uniref:SAP30-binding protein n=1 Tax=Acrobeloides nanus TaxID=290746 RepID=A0A914EA77_9BILA
MSINGTKRSQETCNDSENSKTSKWEDIEDDDTNSPRKKDSSELNKDRLARFVSTYSSLSSISTESPNGSDISKNHFSSERDSFDEPDPAPSQTSELDIEESIEILKNVLLPSPVYMESISLTSFSPPREGFMFSIVPPSPTGQVDEEVQMRFTRYWQLKEQGKDMNAYITNQKKFKNPAIYKSLIKRFGIDEVGTNFPKNVFDPHTFEEDSYYDRLDWVMISGTKMGGKAEAQHRPKKPTNAQKLVNKPKPNTEAGG